MGWVDEQIKQRIKNDDEAFFEAFEKMASVIAKKRTLESCMNQQMKQSRSAIEEILRYFRIEPLEDVGHIKDVNEQLEYQLRPHGIMHREVTLRDCWYRDGIGVMLASTVSGDIIALIPRKSHGYCFLDKKSDKYIKVTKHNQANINREAICFYSALPQKKLTTTDLLKYLAKIPTSADLFLIVFTAFIIALLGLFTPKVTSLLFSHVALSKDKTLLLASMVLLAGVTITSALIEVIKTLLITRMQTKSEIVIESAIMMRILSLPSKFFKDYSSGDIGGRMQSIRMLCALIYEAIFTIGITSIFSLIYILQIFEYAPTLALCASLIIGATLIVSILTTYTQMKIDKKKTQFKVKESGLVFSIISGITKIKLAGAEKRFFALWADKYVNSAKLEYAPPTIIKYNIVFTTAISLIGTISIYIVTIKNGVSVSNYMAFNSSYAMVTAAFLALSTVAITAAKISPILELARPILEAEPEYAQNKKIVDRLSGRIELNRISFRYSDTMPLVIDDLTLKIKSGQYVAIVGGTGCGKSTLMRIMLGFETPSKGAVYYDGKDLASLDLRSLRQKIGVVMQDGKLFAGDIYSNIVISNPRLTLDDAWQAAKLAGMDEDIQRLPMGMHTIISEGSGGFSGGQKQRLMIARAVASKPKILMFDEATSALDNNTQKIVSDSLTKLKCTRIVIAHRLSTIKQCDRIIVLDKGKIIEDGTYDELIENNGFFSELVKRQQVEN